MLVSADCARGQLPPCPGAWASPSSACWCSPCLDGPEVSSGAGNEGEVGDRELCRWVDWGTWVDWGDLGTPSSNSEPRPCCLLAREPRLCSHVMRPGRWWRCGRSRAGRKQWIPPGLPPSLSFSSVFWLFRCFRVSPLFSSLCVCAYKYVWIKLEPYHMYGFVSCIFHFTL